MLTCHLFKKKNKPKKKRQLKIFSRSRRGFSWSCCCVSDVLSQGFQQFSPVVIEISIDLIYCLVLHNPQLAVSVSNQSLVVADNDNSWTYKDTHTKEKIIPKQVTSLMLIRTCRKTTSGQGANTDKNKQYDSWKNKYAKYNNS